MPQIAIVEDDVQEKTRLCEHLDRYARAHGAEFQATWYASGEAFLSERRSVDLVFLDIDLPGGINGMEAAQLLRAYDTETPIIFVTNLAQYAVRGYAVDALDFMVKPVTYPDFELRMNKAMRVLSRRTDQMIVIHGAKGDRVTAVGDICYVEISNHDLVWHRATAPVRGDMDEVERGTMKQAEAELPEELFCRISNSCLVNMAHIELVRHDAIVTDTGVTLYYSRARKRAAMEKIAAYFGSSI